MKDYRSTEEMLNFSPALAVLSESVVARLKPQSVREGTWTGPDPDGKTPILDAFERMPDAPYAECLAQGIVDSWLTAPVIIYEEDLLVGVPRPQRPLYEHFSWGIGFNHWALNSSPYKENADNIRARIEAQRSRLFPLDWKHVEAESERIFDKKVLPSLGRLWNAGGYQGHTVPNYPRLLSRGIGGTLADVRKYAANTNDEEKLTLYRAMEILLHGLTDYMLLYAEKADELASLTDDGAKALRFRRIAENCRAISFDKPQTFYQAAQLTWFYSLWDWVDCVGRTDQYLYPFYKKAIEKADVFPAEDITAALFLKFMEHGVHNIPLGGVRPEDGSDATNELTFLFLQLARRLHSVHPRLCARIHEDSPPELMQLIVKMWSEGMSDPTLVSDKLVIEGLMEYGVSLEDARDYTTLGCQEIEIPGRSNFGCEDGVFNLAKVFEYTINDGKDRFDDCQVGLHTGYLPKFKSIDDLWNAFLDQMRYLTKHFITLCNRGQEIRNANLSKLVKSLFTDDCISRGVNLDGGGSVYNYGVVETAGASAVADSFAAIHRLVFEEKKITPETLEAAIAADFDGYEKERQMLLNLAPKYGNDDPLADEYMSRILDAFWTEIGKYKSVRGGKFMGACSLLQGGISFGRNTWALPDGRHTGEELGNTIGPRTGADKNGLTAMLNSVVKLPLKKGVGGTTLNVLIPKDFTKTEEQRKKIEALMTSYMMNGGQMAQITTASREEMLDAKEHPERHGDLIVRVGGFSTRFIELDEGTQNEIIKRYA